MTDKVEAPRFARASFIPKHLAAFVVVGSLSALAGFYPGILLAALAPLFALPQAGKADKKTFIISTVLALVLLACAYALSLLLFVMALGRGSWR